MQTLGSCLLLKSTHQLQHQYHTLKKIATAFFGADKNRLVIKPTKSTAIVRRKVGYKLATSIKW